MVSDATRYPHAIRGRCEKRGVGVDVDVGVGVVGNGE